jgi:hypothetical protein
MFLGWQSLVCLISIANSQPIKLLVSHNDHWDIRNEIFSFVLCFVMFLIILHLWFHLNESQQRYFCTNCPARPQKIEFSTKCPCKHTHLGIFFKNLETFCLQMQSAQENWVAHSLANPGRPNSYHYQKQGSNPAHLYSCCNYHINKRK